MIDRYTTGLKWQMALFRFSYISDYREQARAPRGGRAVRLVGAGFISHANALRAVPR